MRRILAAATAGALSAGPAIAASGEYGFVSLRNTDFIVLIGFAVFLAIVFYYKVPPMLMGMLDKRADGIRHDLDEARELREEAQTLLASYERKTREARDQADDIVAAARRDAEVAAEQAKKDLEASVERRLAAAEEQIASAQAAALRDVRNRAVQVATAAAADVLARQMGPSEQDAMIDNAIGQVEAKMH
jgi:F-type H+-transporting ATPase subunit b